MKQLIRLCGALLGMLILLCGCTPQPSDIAADSQISSSSASDFIFFSFFSNDTGAILPLTVSDDSEVTAARRLSCDLDASRPGIMAVHDQYTLTNPTDHEIVLPLFYPIQFGSSQTAVPPAVTVNTQPVENTWEQHGQKLLSQIELTLPARGSADVSFAYEKPGSLDAPGNEAIADRYFGFSIAPWRTSLPFTQQELLLSAPDELSLRWNPALDFDSASGIHSVFLKPDIESYDLTVLYPVF
ncbi:MAG: hypothetical protein KH319_08430 [Butyricicoccus pullicaecorum]|jgi:hypothetical protein|nr:hypothetical protein [Butyricicoccus pullicaecorum]